MSKDEWIKRAKMLLFDLQFTTDSAYLTYEINQLIEQGGGYDYVTATSGKFPEGED